MNSKFINDISNKVLLIHECKTTTESLGFFNFIRLYGLIESISISNIEELKKKKNQILMYYIIPISSSLLYSYFNVKIFRYIFNISFVYITYKYWKQAKLINSRIIDLGKTYKERANKFSKTKDFRILNPDFINEKINISEMNLIQYSYKI